MLLLNIDHVPGREIEALGIVKGTVVQSKNFGKDFMAGMKTLVGGEITGYTEMLIEARQIATKRMVDEASALGADAVINIRRKAAVNQIGHKNPRKAVPSGGFTSLRFILQSQQVIRGDLEELRQEDQFFDGGSAQTALDPADRRLGQAKHLSQPLLAELSRFSQLFYTKRKQLQVIHKNSLTYR